MKVLILLICVSLVNPVFGGNSLASSVTAQQKTRPYKYGEKFDINNHQIDYSMCPEPGCKGKSLAVCKCPMAESVCSHGHKWRVDIQTGCVVKDGPNYPRPPIYY